MKNDSLTVFHCDPGRTGKILVGLCHRNDGIGINFRMILLLSLLYIIIAINQPIMLEKFGHKAYFWLADKMLTKGKPPLVARAGKNAKSGGVVGRVVATPLLPD